MLWFRLKGLLGAEGSHYLGQSGTKFVAFQCVCVAFLLAPQQWEVADYICTWVKTISDSYQ